MRVTVRLFARLRDIAGAAEITREIQPGATIGSVWQQLAGEYPELVPYERSISSAFTADAHDPSGGRLAQRVLGRHHRIECASRLNGHLQHRTTSRYRYSIQTY